MTSATERLRKLLDERGVEWKDDSPSISMKPWKTSFTSFTGEEVTIAAYDEPKWLMGTMVFYTPEQAVEATLGRGECKLEPLSAIDVTLNMLELTEWGACSECGCAVPMDARFCNECGKVVER